MPVRNPPDAESVLAARIIANADLKPGEARRIARLIIDDLETYGFEIVRKKPK